MKVSQDQIIGIINGKNSEIERAATQQATKKIERILQLQNHIAECQTEMAELRKELKEIEITPIDPDAVLGQEQ